MLSLHHCLHLVNAGSPIIDCARVVIDLGGSARIGVLVDPNACLTDRCKDVLRARSYAFAFVRVVKILISHYILPVREYTVSSSAFVDA